MNNRFAFGTAALLALAVGSPAHALTLTNQDDKAYEVTVTVGEGDAAIETFKLESGAGKFDICSDGCTIRLDNGTMQSFDGDESVTIQDGSLVMTE